MKSICFKFLSSFLVIVMIVFSICFLQSFAVSENFQEDCEKYLSENCNRVLNGEKVVFENGPIEYDLFVIAHQNDLKFNPDGDSVNFASEYDYSAHQRICADALRILLHDKGNSRYNGTYTKDGETKSFNDLLIANSAEPDSSEKGDYKGVGEDGQLVYQSLNILHPFSNFCGHFYNPYTELNNVDSNDNTAKLNARRHYDAAVNLYQQANYVLALTELGKGIHYVQDACECHHAAGEDAVATGNNHADFETMIDTEIQAQNGWTLIGSLPDGEGYYDSSIYGEALHLSVENLVRNNGYSSYCLLAKSKTSNVDATDTIYATYKNATISTTQYLYKFANEVGITFS